MKPTVLDLFSGCGGMSFGLAQAGFDICAGLDNNAPALRTFKRNMPSATVLETDLSTSDPHECLAKVSVEPGDIDVLIGGPPCQGFSKNVPRSSRLWDDPKNMLIRSFLAFVPVLRPKCILMENVAEMYNAFDGAFSKEIAKRLDGWGYSCEPIVHDAADFGVPQRRRRVTFLATRANLRPEHPVAGYAPREEGASLFRSKLHRTVWDAIGDLDSITGDRPHSNRYACKPSNDFQRQMREGDMPLTDHQLRHLRATQQARYNSIEAGQGLRDLPKHLRPKSGYSGAYGRLTKDMVAPTITRWVFHPGSGRFGHPVEPRILTIREVARIQSFPDHFVFEGTNIEKSHQLGNAVPPMLATAFASELRRLVQACSRVDRASPQESGALQAAHG